MSTPASALRFVIVTGMSGAGRRTACHTLEDLAALFGLDRFAFLRQFKKKTGMTPYAWLKRLRLEQGKRLLGSGLPVSEVALAVGFFDQSHVHHGFRQAFGLTPAEYRQQMLPA